MVREKEGATIDSLAIDWQGEYTSYDRPEDWLPKLEEHKVSPWILGQMILANHNEGRFLTHVTEETVLAGSSVQLRVEGITPLAPLAILSGRLNGGPLDLFGEVIIPYEESLDALVRIPTDAARGTYVFFAQQWEPGGQPAYTGGSFIYASSISSVKVRPHIDEEAFWSSFEPWSEEDAEEIMENVREGRKRVY